MALRTFTARDGSVWNVWNVVPTLARNEQKLALGIGMAGGWLCFESGEAKRRLIPVPAGWEAWSDDELDGALGGAEPVERRRFPRDDSLSSI
jgi:hypothetical protein